MPRPDLAQVPHFYHKYIGLVTSDSIQEIFEQHAQSLQFLKTIPADKWSYRYAEGKWSIKEMVQHLIDAERIFSYRALTFARQDKNALPSFDENAYAAVSKADARKPKSLLAEIETVGESSRQLFLSFDEEQLQSSGIANNNPIQVQAIGFIIVGHMKHHINILKERYL